MNLHKFLFMFIATLTATQASDELLFNGDFSAGSEGWHVELHHSAAAFLTTDEDEKAAVLEILSEDPDSAEGWHVQLAQTGLYLEKGKTYLLKFTMKSSPVVGCHVGLFHAEAPFSKVADGYYVNLGNESADFEFRLKVTESSDNGRLVFTGLNQAGVTFRISNLSLVELKR